MHEQQQVAVFLEVPKDIHRNHGLVYATMAGSPSKPAEADARRPAVDLIDAVLSNMREYREPLKYSVIAPSRYTVYMHPAEMTRLQGILPLLREQAERALSEEMAALNRRALVHRWLDRVRSRRPTPVQNIEGRWHVDFLADPDGEVEPGGIIVHSELQLPVADLGTGQGTRRITTVRTGGQLTSRERVQTRAATIPASAARLEYEDAAGRHTYEIQQTSVTIGRGGTMYPVDVRVTSSPDVSREHARIRFDSQRGHHFLIDLSSLGTTIDGRAVPRGFDDTNGRRRENGAEAALHDGARIGLADMVYMTFHTQP